MIKQRVDTNIHETLPTSILKDAQDNREPISASDSNFFALTEIRIREATTATHPISGEDYKTVATQFCTGGLVDIEGFEPSEPGLLFLAAAHCGTEAPEGGFHVDLDLSYVDELGQSQTIHLETNNPEHFWHSSTYGGYVDAGDEHGDNDLSLIFIPTNQRLPDKIQPLVFNPTDNNSLIGQYGESLMVPTAGADSLDMRVDRQASLKTNHGVGESAEMHAHVSISTSGAPVIPHVNGDPVRDEVGRIRTIGPIASIAIGTGIALFANPDPEIFAEVPFLRPANGQDNSHILLSEAQATPQPVIGSADPVVVTTPTQSLESLGPEGIVLSQGDAELFGYVSVAETISEVHTTPLQVTTPTQSLESLGPEGIVLSQSDAELFGYVSVAETIPEVHTTPLEVTTPTQGWENLGSEGIALSQGDTGLVEYESFASTVDLYSAEPNSQLLQQINEIGPIIPAGDDVFFDINLTDRGYVISDASEFTPKSEATQYASHQPDNNGALFTIKF